MWDYDGFIGKARLYFTRGAEHEHSDDDEFAIWHLLGFEFLLRTPLANLHPSLLAATNDSDSLLAANGVTTPKDPKSVASGVVIDRLARIVPEFAGDAVSDSLFLMNLRNAELHASNAAVSEVPNDLWLPKLVRVAKIICQHLAIDPQDVLDDAVVKLGEILLDEADKKVARGVELKIQACLSFLEKLSQDEIAARVAAAEPTGLELLARQRTTAAVKCPVCEHTVYAPKTYVRSAREHLDGDTVIRDDIYLLDELKCPVCGLELLGAPELVAAQVPQQVTEQEHESLDERYQVESNYDGPEYMDE
ncbi:hypothetical protein GOEFS_054_00290 [Gordonia effusa NBRC 100432]|uniref:DUF4145 domain-containing protein n=1 Tax=Gordonia effusa NBRC 100432 TaxID=1077974 RepID=H0R015_9ACTN|nr:hypothetical protein [Gordonia effusa]GAB18416.1 hypothetical protein GOEFS_054_00290 [Gordonia effusa NBRC 100432]